MFSTRLPWGFEPNRLARLLERKQGSPILDLTESNPTRAGLRYPEPQILEAIASPRALLYEPAPAGAPEARAAVAAYYAARGVDADPGHILLTASTSEAYAYLFKLLADPGDEVLVPRPSYPLFEFLASLESVRVRPYPLVYHHGWSIDFDALRAALTARTRAVILVNPNNPTGSFLKTGELAELLRICAERRLALLSDEVFADFAFAPDSRRVATLAGVDQVLTFCLSGLSKIAGLPQMKLGWIALAGPHAAEAFRRLELIADTYLSVSTPVQHAAPRLLELADELRRQIQTRVCDNLQHVRAELGSESPARVLEVEGGWYVTVQVPRVRGEEEWALELLDRHDVLVQPGFFYDFESEAFLVLSLLTPTDTFREGVRRLNEVLDE